MPRASDSLCARRRGFLPGTGGSRLSAPRRPPTGQRGGRARRARRIEAAGSLAITDVRIAGGSAEDRRFAVASRPARSRCVRMRYSPGALVRNPRKRPGRSLSASRPSDATAGSCERAAPPEESSPECLSRGMLSCPFGASIALDCGDQGMPRGVVRQNENRRLTSLHEVARHGEDEVRVVPEHSGQELVGRLTCDVGAPLHQWFGPAGCLTLIKGFGSSDRNPTGCAGNTATTRFGARFMRFQMKGPQYRSRAP